MATRKEHRLAVITNTLTNEIIHCRDLLEPIIAGEIEREHCLAGKSIGYLDTPGKRKTKLKDAVAIAKTIAFRLNAAVNRFDKEMSEEEFRAS